MRRARCTYFSKCKSEIDSHFELCFFESQGVDTVSATLCECGFFSEVHTSESNHIGACNNYNPRGDLGYDQYYCGCRGFE